MDMSKAVKGAEILFALKKASDGIGYRHNEIIRFEQSNHWAYPIRDEAARYPENILLKHFHANGPWLAGEHFYLALIDPDSKYTQLRILRYVDGGITRRGGKFDEQFDNLLSAVSKILHVEFEKYRVI